MIVKFETNLQIFYSQILPRWFTVREVHRQLKPYFSPSCSTRICSLSYAFMHSSLPYLVFCLAASDKWDDLESCDCAQVREEIELGNIAKLFLKEKIKQECWDSMEVQGKTIKVRGLFMSLGVNALL